MWILDLGLSSNFHGANRSLSTLQLPRRVSVNIESGGGEAHSADHSQQCQESNGRVWLDYIPKLLLLPRYDIMEIGTEADRQQDR